MTTPECAVAFVVFSQEPSKHQLTVELQDTPVHSSPSFIPINPSQVHLDRSRPHSQSILIVESPLSRTMGTTIHWLSRSCTSFENLACFRYIWIFAMGGTLYAVERAGLGL